MYILCLILIDLWFCMSQNITGKVRFSCECIIFAPNIPAEKLPKRARHQTIAINLLD